MRFPTARPTIEQRIVAVLLILVVILTGTLIGTNTNATRRQAEWDTRATQALVAADSLTQRIETLEATAKTLTALAAKWHAKSDSSERNARRDRQAVTRAMSAIPSVVADSTEPMTLIAARWETAARDAVAVADLALHAKEQADVAIVLYQQTEQVLREALLHSTTRGDSLHAVVVARPKPRQCRVLKIGCKTWAFLGGVATGAIISR